MKEWRSRYLAVKGSHLFVGKDQVGSPHDAVDLSEALRCDLSEGGIGFIVVTR